MSWKASRYGKQKRRHYAGRNYHHFLRAKSKGGDSSPNNLLLISIEKHEAFNRLFGATCSAEKALEILKRAVRAKKNQHSDHRTEPKFTVLPGEKIAKYV